MMRRRASKTNMIMRGARIGGEFTKTMRKRERETKC